MRIPQLTLVLALVAASLPTTVDADLKCDHLLTTTPNANPESGANLQIVDMASGVVTNLGEFSNKQVTGLTYSLDADTTFAIKETQSGSISRGIKKKEAILFELEEPTSAEMDFVGQTKIKRLVGLTARSNSTQAKYQGWLYSMRRGKIVTAINPATGEGEQIAKYKPGGLGAWGPGIRARSEKLIDIAYVPAQDKFYGTDGSFFYCVNPQNGIASIWGPLVFAQTENVVDFGVVALMSDPTTGKMYILTDDEDPVLYRVSRRERCGSLLSPVAMTRSH